MPKNVNFNLSDGSLASSFQLTGYLIIHILNTLPMKLFTTVRMNMAMCILGGAVSTYGV